MNQPDLLDSSWVGYSTRCQFSFVAPSGLVDQSSQGTDSCTVSYAGDGCTYLGDYGLYSASLEGFSSEPNYAVNTIQVSGQPAMLIHAGPRINPDQPPYVVGLHAPHTLNIALNFIAECKTTEAEAVAVRVLQTVRFAD